MTDARTITITYDWRRGEPRGKLTRGGADPRGDCIDCHQCVTVCPTGIDIRNGIQLECVNCTACIDACNGVMARVGKPPGLIRYTSHHKVATADRRSIGSTPSVQANVAARIARALAQSLSARAAAYAAVWLVLVSSVVLLLAMRRDLDVLVLRQPGTLYQTVAGGDLANFYNVQAFNRTGRSQVFTIEVAEPRGATVVALGPFGDVGPYGLVESRLMVRLHPETIAGPSTPVRFLVRADNQVVQTIDSSFLGPARP